MVPEAHGVQSAAFNEPDSTHMPTGLPEVCSDTPPRSVNSMHPEDQLQLQRRERESEEIASYWRRNAPTTFAALVACVIASSFAQPINLFSAASFTALGFMFYIGWLFNRKGRENIGGLIMVGVVIASAITASVIGMRPGPMFYVQGVGILIAAFCGIMVFHEAIREEHNDDVSS